MKFLVLLFTLSLFLLIQCQEIDYELSELESSDVESPPEELENDKLEAEQESQTLPNTVEKEPQTLAKKDQSIDPNSLLRQTEAPIGISSRTEPSTSIFGKNAVKVSIFIGSVLVFLIVGFVGLLAIFGLVAGTRKSQKDDFVEMPTELTQEELDSLIKRNTKTTHVPSYKVPTTVVE
jgi:hypothetical protein